MSISISIPEKPILKPKIVVFGVGGGGCNAVNNMISGLLEGVDFVVANTDAQSLAQSQAACSIQMGVKRTQGLGAGSQPEVGFDAAEEVIGEITDAMSGAHMVFITAGMGGGTGTGAAPVVARIAKEQGALSVGVVTKPFLFEGNRRLDIAEEGIIEIEKYVDTLVVIPNQNLFRIASEQTSLSEAFAMADRVLFSAVAGIANLMVRPGLINLDFADVRTIMSEMGKAMIGTGEARGEQRAIVAAENALNNPLLDDVTMKGAKGVLISVSGHKDMTLYEVEQATNRIRCEVDKDAQIIFGATTDETLDDLLRVSLVATGIEQSHQSAAHNEMMASAAQGNGVDDEAAAPSFAHSEEEERVSEAGEVGEETIPPLNEEEISPNIEPPNVKPFGPMPPSMHKVMNSQSPQHSSKHIGRPQEKTLFDRLKRKFQKSDNAQFEEDKTRPQEATPQETAPQEAMPQEQEALSLHLEKDCDHRDESHRDESHRDESLEIPTFLKEQNH